MSYVIAAPEFVTAAATDLAGIGSSLSEGQRGGRRLDHQSDHRRWR